MSTLLDLDITQTKSYDFLKISIILHAFSIFMLVQSTCPVFCVVLLITIIVISLIMTLCAPLADSKWITLTYRNHNWTVTTRTGEIFHYKQANIRFNAGFYLQLLLLNPQQNVSTKQDASSIAFSKKSIIIFHDILSHTERHKLNIACKKNP